MLAAAALGNAPAVARGGFNRDCKVPRISLCPGCTVNVNIIVLQDHACHINYGSLGPMHMPIVLVNPKRGTYSVANETSQARPASATPMIIPVFLAAMFRWFLISPLTTMAGSHLHIVQSARFRLA